MSLGVLYAVVNSMLDLLVVSRRTDAALQVDVLALRIISASSNARSASVDFNRPTVWFSAP